MRALLLAPWLLPLRVLYVAFVVLTWTAEPLFNLLLRLDPVWFRGENERLARLAIRVFDDDPQGWFAWPLPPGTPQASSALDR